MDALTVVANQYLATIAQLSARIAQAALELTAAQERIAELEKPKDAPKLASVPDVQPVVESA